MDFITLYDGSGNRLRRRTVSYSAAVITITLHLPNQSYHVQKKTFSFPFAVNMLFIPSIPYTDLPQVLFLSTEQRTENRTEQEDIY